VKLLLENWRKYLAEDEAQHFPWLKEIQAANSLEDIWDILESDLFKKVGSGAFRRVFSPANDPEYVIKVINENDPDKMQMNKDDFDTAKRYPLIFPKGYAHADDFSWVVTEYASPIVWPSQMQKVLDQSFPKEQEALLKVADKLKFNPADPFHVMKMIMASFRDDRPINEVSSAAVAADRAELSQKTLAPEARGWFAGKMAMGLAYQELSKAMHEFEIDKAELGEGNIGFDKDYNFKIIDSSVFSSDPEDGV
jgi:hypothetical protein